MHIPKCGGTSLTVALRRVCPLYRQFATVDADASRLAAAVAAGHSPSTTLIHEDGPRCAELFAFRRSLVVYYMARDMALINGHFLFDRAAFSAFLGEYKFVTILRDPLRRVLSNYGDARVANYVTCSFGEYLESDVAWRHANVFTRYFGESAQFPEEESRERVRLAKDNMKYFAIVGFIDRLDDFRNKFSSLFGRRISIGHYRRARIEKPTLTQQNQRRLEDLCAADLELYEFARERFP